MAALASISGVGSSVGSLGVRSNDSASYLGVPSGDIAGRVFSTNFGALLEPATLVCCCRVGVPSSDIVLRVKEGFLC